MSVKAKVPTQLRALTSRPGEISGAGSDVHALIEDLDSRHPGLRERLLDGFGRSASLRQPLCERRGRSLPRRPRDRVARRAKVSIIPAVAGG